MPINKNYTIEKIWVKDGLITTVQFRVVFTDDTLPGVSSRHAGVTSLEVFGLSSETENEDIANVLETMEPAGLVDFHTQQLQFEYAMKTSTEEEREGPDTPDNLFPPLTRRQIRLGLFANGITVEDVNAVIDAIPDETDKAVAKIEWQDASQFERDHALIAQVGSAMGLTEPQIDAMWTDAAKL